MALMRLTCCPDAAPGADGGAPWALFAPDADGVWRPGDYDAQTGIGRIGGLGNRGLRRRLEAHLSRESALRLSALAPGAPLCVMVHGFQYDPRAPVSHDHGRAANPHGQIFHLDPGRASDAIGSHAISWPLGLGFEGDSGESGLAVGYGWASDPTYAYGDWRDWLSRLRWSEAGAETYYTAAYRTAPIAAQGLAELLRSLRKTCPEQEIDIVAHSLGARVALLALRILAEEDDHAVLGGVGRVLLLCGASHWLDARRALESIAAINRARPQIFNIMLSRDAALAYWGRRLAAFTEAGPARPSLRERLWLMLFGGRVIGLDGKPQGVAFSAWMDLYLDRPALQNWASRLDAPLDFRPTWRNARADHWACFTWPPYLEFYRRLLRDRRRWSLTMLRWGEGMRPPIPQGWRTPADAPGHRRGRLRAASLSRLLRRYLSRLWGGADEQRR